MDAMPDEKKELHASQIVDKDKEFLSNCVGVIAFFPTLIGLLMVLQVNGNDAKRFGAVLAFIGIIGIVVSLIMRHSSGASDTRCKKCNSNLLRFQKSDEKFEGTYSKRKIIVNNVTRREEEISVVCTDFRITDHWSCGLCSNHWTTSRTVTKEG